MANKIDIRAGDWIFIQIYWKSVSSGENNGLKHFLTFYASQTNSKLDDKTMKQMEFVSDGGGLLVTNRIFLTLPATNKRKVISVPDFPGHPSLCFYVGKNIRCGFNVWIPKNRIW